MTQPNFIDYQQPATPNRRPTVHIPMLALFLLIAVSWTLLQSLIVPRFEEVFKDFGTKLPAITVMLLNASRNPLTVVFVWMFCLALPFVAAALTPRSEKPRRSGTYFCFAVVAFLVFVAYVIAVVIALFMPYITLIQSVSGGTGFLHA